jgi:uncharacterized membrane protein YeaQ/YmgE (transglycosylase-associated protein family)
VTLALINLQPGLNLQPGGILAWIVVGLIAGFLAGHVMRSHLGLVGDAIVGVVGALIGGFVVGFFVHGSLGFVGTTVVAFIGAVILLALLRLLRGGRHLA